jgi:hypothetical protein
VGCLGAAHPGFQPGRRPQHLSNDDSDKHRAKRDGGLDRAHIPKFRSDTETYSGGTATPVKPASNVLTTVPSVDGRSHDGIFWNQPQLISFSSTSSSAQTDLAPLVPDWIYTSRNGTHPTTYAANLGPANNGTLTSTSIVGRYAYNIYDIGGLLNANAAGYGVLSGSPTDATETPSPTSADTMIVPGYKGSVLMADLSGLALGGTLPAAGSNYSNPASLTNWQSVLPAFRYQPVNSQSWATDLAKLFASGQFAGWLQPFLAPLDPKTATAGSPNTSLTPLTSNVFTSRQDLINWINYEYPPTSGSTTGSPGAWILPYLTHFSFDTDAPTYTPPNYNSRPQDTYPISSGGNDAAGTDYLINPGFISPSSANGSPTAVNTFDTNGYPLVKRRFPLSCLALLNNVYPQHPPASALAAQITYDFGLSWDPVNNRWNYQDAEGGTSNIKKFSEIAALSVSRSPNFFELLKAAITTGSLGKQWGENFDGDPNFAVGAGYSSTTNYQIMQIGANIISQSTTNYYPTAVQYSGVTFYGVKDLPYLYRSRLMNGLVGSFSSPLMTNIGTVGPGTSVLGAVMIQPELWNPHAPNAVTAAGSSAPYPVAFRIVPITTKASGIFEYQALGASPGALVWKNGGNFPSGILYSADFSPAGGPYCANLPVYMPGSAYIQFSASAPSSTLPAPLDSFRQPVPLAAPGFPNASTIGYPVDATLAVGGGGWTGNPNTEVNVTANAIPSVYTAATPIKKMLGFLIGYYCSGPLAGGTNGQNGFNLGITYWNGGMSLSLQYSPDGTNFYPYDTMTSAFPGGGTKGGGGYGVVSGVVQTEVGTRIDPRSQRWGNSWTALAGGNSAPYGSNASLYPGVSQAPSPDLTATEGGCQDPPLNPQGWNNTSSSAWGWLQVNPGAGTYAYTQGATAGVNYADPDGVFRPADDAYGFANNAYGTTGSGIGLPEVSVGVQNGPAGSGSTVNPPYDNRPVVLNRPFQSVAELGYVFRDTPWRSLDFTNPQSGDSALLDVFSVYGPDPWSYAPQKYNGANTTTTYLNEKGLVAGHVNLNTRQPGVLAALLKGASTTTPTSNPSTGLTVLSDAQAATVAESLVGWTTGTTSPASNEGPLRNPADLVGKLVSTSTAVPFLYNGFSTQLTTLLAGTGSGGTNYPESIKQQRECVMHALGDTGTTRTWNLLIDLVAQTGQLAVSATSLTNFVVNGERHVWVSVAIDRVTGKVIKMQVEPVRL